MPYVFAGGELLGGCDATKALIASGEFDKRVGRAATAAKGADVQNGTSEGAGDAAAVHDALRGFTARALRVYDDMEDHIRPVMRRYVPGPVQVRARLWVGGVFFCRCACWACQGLRRTCSSCGAKRECVHHWRRHRMNARAHLGGSQQGCRG